MTGVSNDKETICAQMKDPVLVFLGAGVQFPQSVSVLLDLTSEGITLALLGAGHSPETRKHNLGTTRKDPGYPYLYDRLFVLVFSFMGVSVTRIFRWGFR